MRKTLLAAGGALALAAAIPLAALAEGGWHDGKGRHHGWGHGAKARALEMIEAYDADGDGKVTQAEVDAFRAGRHKAFDADGDGQLSLAEYEALWLDAMRERMVRGFQRHDADGDGRVTAAEFGERQKNLVTLRDRNGDGALDLEDAMRHGPRGEGRGEGHGMGRGMPQPQ